MEVSVRAYKRKSKTGKIVEVKGYVRKGRPSKKGNLIVSPVTPKVSPGTEFWVRSQNTVSPEKRKQILAREAALGYKRPGMESIESWKKRVSEMDDRWNANKPKKQQVKKIVKETRPVKKDITFLDRLGTKIGKFIEKRRKK